MINFEVADILEHLAVILEFGKYENTFFRVRALRSGAQILRNLPEDAGNLSYEELIKIKGIGKGIADKIIEYKKTGEVKEIAEKAKAIPPGIFDLLKVPSLGPKRTKQIYETLGISDLVELEENIKNGKISELPGFGKKSAENILWGIKMFHGNVERKPRGKVLPVVKEIVEQVKNAKLVDQIEIAGSIRRGLDTVHDGDILATGPDSQKIIDYFCKLDQVDKILAQGDTKASVIVNSGIHSVEFQVDLRVVPPKSWGSALIYFTGSKNHNIVIRQKAIKKGMKLSEWGLFDTSKTRSHNPLFIDSSTEEKIYKALNLLWIPPELRENNGEIEAAEKKQLPNLIEQKDIKGSLHIHSNFSDGKNTIEEIVQSSINLGYKYIAITDHSKSLIIGNGLNKNRLKKQKKEIDQARKKYPKLKILWGTECDILANGELDYSNKTLKKFDFVIASIHSKFHQDNTKRILKAINNPYVNCIGHPTGRLFGVREAYPIDTDKIFEACVKTGTALEINSHYMRLDLRAALCRKAKKNGVKFIISTDVHTISNFDNLHFGVTIARRGWLEKKDVLNTGSVKKIEKFVKKKRNLLE